MKIDADQLSRLNFVTPADRSRSFQELSRLKLMTDADRASPPDIFFSKIVGDTQHPLHSLIAHRIPQRFVPEIILDLTAPKPVVQTKVVSGPSAPEVKEEARSIREDLRTKLPRTRNVVAALAVIGITVLPEILIQSFVSPANMQIVGTAVAFVTVPALFLIVLAAAFWPEKSKG